MARQTNKRVLIGLIAVIVIAVFAAVIGIIVYLSRGNDKPNKTVQEFSPVFDVRFSLNQTWDPNYGNPSSPQFQQLRTQIINEMDKVFKATVNNAGEQYNYTEVVSFTNGSVICDVRVYWKKNRHVHKDKVGITTTEINEVLIYHTVVEAIKTASEDPSSSLLSTAIGRSLSVTSVDEGDSAETSKTPSPKPPPQTTRGATTTTTHPSTTTRATTITTTTAPQPPTTTTRATTTTQKTTTWLPSTTTSQTPTTTAAGPCNNETLIVQQALPCLAPRIQDVQSANNQTEFCRVLEDIGDCIIQGIKRATSVQCSDDDKYNAVMKYQTELTSIFTTYGITYKIDPCLPT